MRHRSILIASLVMMMAGFFIAGGLPARAAGSPVGTWGTAQVAPGTSAADGADVGAVSCAPHGECTALVASGLNGTNDLASSIVTEQDGTWGTEVAIPGLTAIAPAGFTLATGLSCPRSGYCLVTGIYAYGKADSSVGGFTVWESNGRWRAPAKIPGLAKLNTAGLAIPTEVACASTHTCVVSGMYTTGASSNPNVSTFIAQDLYGTWKNAIQAPGLPKPTSSGPIAPTALSCPTQGNCVLGLGSPDLSVAVGVGGSGPPGPAVRGAHRLTGRALLRSLAATHPVATAVTTAAASSQQARAAIETHGTWQKAQKVGPAVSASGFAGITAVACPATGKCVLAGAAVSSGFSSGYSSFIVTESGKSWSKPVRISSIGIGTLACPVAGSCVAGGMDGRGVAAILAQKRGKWGTPTELPSVRDLSHGTAKAQESEVDYLVCPSAGNCSVGGSYSWDANNSNLGQEVFVGGEANGGWGHVRVPAGIAGLNTGLVASFTSLSCASAANCAAGGIYDDTVDDTGGFVVAETPTR